MSPAQKRGNGRKSRTGGGPESWRLKLLLLHKTNTKQNQKLNLSSGFSFQTSVPEQAVLILGFAGDFLLVLRDEQPHPAPNTWWELHQSNYIPKGSSHLWHSSGPWAAGKPKSWGFLSAKASGNLWEGRFWDPFVAESSLSRAGVAGTWISIPGGTNSWILVSSVARAPEQLFSPGSHLWISLSCSELVLVQTWHVRCWG